VPLTFAVAASMAVGIVVFSLWHDVIITAEHNTAMDFNMLVVRINKQLLVIQQQDSV
jgi:hypothetical protein